MPYFHGTQAHRLASILVHGLGGAQTEQNWPGCDPGVYLATNPSICLFVMMEQMMKFMADDASPKDLVAGMRVIVIDDTRIDRRKLGADPSIARDDVWLYDGVIDVRGQAVVGVDDVMAGFEPSEIDLLSDRATIDWIRHCRLFRDEANSV